LAGGPWHWPASATGHLDLTDSQVLVVAPLTLRGDPQTVPQERLLLYSKADKGNCPTWMLRITVHDYPGAVVLQLEGRVAAPWLRELEKCWQKTVASLGKPVLTVDVT
jgi:hypothetical protein